MLEPIWLRNDFVGDYLAWNNERVLDIDFIDETRHEQFKMTLAGTDCGTRATQKRNQIDRGLLTWMWGCESFVGAKVTTLCSTSQVLLPQAAQVLCEEGVHGSSVP